MHPELLQRTQEKFGYERHFSILVPPQSGLIFRKENWKDSWSRLSYFFKTLSCVLENNKIAII